MIGPKPAPLAATLVVTAFAVMACPGKTATWFELMIGPMPAPLPATLLVMALGMTVCSGRTGT